MKSKKHSVLIDENLFLNIQDFCEINEIKVSSFIEDSLKKSLNFSKFGDTPFKVESPWVDPIEELPEKHKKVLLKYVKPTITVTENKPKEPVIENKIVETITVNKSSKRKLK